MSDHENTSGDVYAPPPAPPIGWTAPPIGWTAPAPAPPYRSPRGFATVLRWLLLAVLALTAVDAAVNADAAWLIGRLQADANAVSPAQLRASDARVAAVALAQTVVALVTFGFLIAWTSRSYRNLSAFGVRDQRFGPGWAVGAWFVPFLNLVRPKQILDDTWRGSGPAEFAGDDWRRRSVTPVLHWWWGLWIVGGIMSWASFTGPTDLSDARSASVRTAIGDVLFAAATVLAVLVVTRLTARQERRAGRPDAPVNRWETAARLSPLAAFLLAGVVFAGLVVTDRSADGQDETTDETTPTRSSGRTVLTSDLDVGDCFDDPPGWSDTSAEVTEVLAVNVVPCSRAHDEEVVGRLEHPAAAGDAFPGDDILIEYADAECLDAFERWVGRSYFESSLELGYIWPTADSWDQGDRAILCLAFRSGGPELIGSVRDTAI